MLVCVEINLTCKLFSCLLLGMPLVNSLYLISRSGFSLNLILILDCEEVLSPCLNRVIFRHPLWMQVLLKK